MICIVSACISHCIFTHHSPQITYADILFFSFCNGPLNKGNLDVPELLEKNFPDLAKLYESVMDEPVICDYLKKRPVTAY